MEGRGLFLSSVYMLITMPGVQNPHCDPWLSAIRCWTAWSRVLALPMPSTVVTERPGMTGKVIVRKQEVR